ncbi:formylglycine-generating enzyme family protein [Marinifilum sp. JC120]|nr:formylglycine-generating enzyme family protein [Marinifilum sp. JC120]
MLYRLFTLILLIALAVPAHAVDPDEFIGLEFRQQTQKKKPVPSPAVSKTSKSGKTPKAGQLWTEPTTGMQFVWVPGGCFMMGSSDGESDEKPVHEVCVDGFWMGKYEITNAQYRRFKANHNSKRYDGLQLNSDTQPVVRVTWKDAVEFAKWLSAKGQGTFFLPTEAQWEYAARAGAASRYYWGNSDSSACLYENLSDKSFTASRPSWGSFPCNDGYEVSSMVGKFKPNKFGLHDMLGNVSEWCLDCYDEKAYEKHPRSNPVIKGQRYSRVVRGGTWKHHPWNLCSDRYSMGMIDKTKTTGFRLVMVK